MKPLLHVMVLAMVCFAALFAGQANLAIAQQTRQDPKESEGATGSISGRVTIGGKPAAGIVIMARPSEGDHQQMLKQVSEGLRAAKATTDVDGHYRMTDLPIGRYELYPYAPAFVVIKEADMAPSNNLVTLSAGETVEGIDFTLARGGVITGRVTNKDGQPAISERISLRRVGQDGQRSAWNPPEHSEIVTDDRGLYRIFGLPAGRYTVAAGKGVEGSMDIGIKRPSRSQTFHPGVSDEAKATIIEVSGAAEVPNVDIKLGMAKQGYKVAGRVIDGETGKPVPDVLVSFSEIKGEAEMMGIGGVGSPSNSRGEFRLEVAEPGRYRAFGFFGFTAQSEMYSEPIEFEVKTGDVSGVEIKLCRGGSISGVAVIDDANDPDLLARLAQLDLLATVMGNQDPTPNIARGRIGPDGSFRVTGLRPGKVQFILGDYFSSHGFSIMRIEHNGAQKRGGIDLTPGEAITGVIIVFAQTTGVIRGSVQIEGGTLSKNAQMVASARRVEPGAQGHDDDDKDDGLDAEAIFDSSYKHQTSPVDPSGMFVIERLMAGEYEVSVTLMPNPAAGVDKPVTVKQTVTVAKDSQTQITLTLDLRKR